MTEPKAWQALVGALLFNGLVYGTADAQIVNAIFGRLMVGTALLCFLLHGCELLAYKAGVKSGIEIGQGNFSK